MPEPTILIIEDDDDSRILLGEVMRLSGYQVLLEPNGQRGLQTLRASRPALVLLDLHMPVMDGVTFRRHQAADPEVARIPVVCVSAVDPPSAGPELEHVPFVCKPIDFDRLLSVVAGLLAPPNAEDVDAGGSIRDEVERNHAVPLPGPATTADAPHQRLLSQFSSFQTTWTFDRSRSAAGCA